MMNPNIQQNPQIDKEKENKENKFNTKNPK